MFGLSPFGEAPFGALPLPRVSFGGVAEVRVDWRFAIYAASSPLTTQGGDTPSHQPFRGTLDSPIKLRRSLLGGDRIGQFTTGDGEAVLNNTDGAYDFLIGPYSIDGRDVTIKIGRIGDRYSDEFMPVFVGTAEGWLINETSVKLTLRDYGYKLDVPLQPHVYAGTGGINGNIDIAGKRIPRAFGRCRNVTPAILVPNLLIYQLNDGSVEAIDAVYDRGVPLTPGSDYADYGTLADATVSAGTYATCIALGLFRIGSSPAGTVTADCEGDNGEGYVETTADIVRRIVEGVTSISGDARFYAPGFAAVNAAQPATIGFYAGTDDDFLVSDAVANLMRAVGGWAGFRRAGNFEIGIVTAPAAPPTMRFDHAQGDVIAISREPLPSSIYPPPYRFRVGYARNWTVQSDLAGSVSAEHRSFATEQLRVASASSMAIQTDHPRAPDPDVIESYFDLEADAQAEAERLLNLYRASRGFYRVKVDQRGFRLNLGETINLTHPRWDLSAGRQLLVVELSEDGESNEVEFVGFG